MEWYWALLIIAILILVLAGAIVLGIQLIRNAFKGKPLGAACSLHTDCDGWGPGPNDVACCQNVCTRKQVDWAGVGYCPDQCQDAPSPLGKPGSCGSGNSWPRKEGQPCDTSAACEGWVAGKAGTLACCQGKCQKQKADWAGVGYCPNECKGCITCDPGSC
jgi:hypothetical protein